MTRERNVNIPTFGMKKPQLREAVEHTQDPPLLRAGAAFSLSSSSETVTKAAAHPAGAAAL